MRRIPTGFKISFFFNRKFNFPFIFIDKYIKFKVIEYPIDYVNFEI